MHNCSLPKKYHLFNSYYMCYMTLDRHRCKLQLDCLVEAYILDAAILFLMSLSDFYPLLLFSPVSTCITTCKKAAPPPVPPRTTSKPYISVTVQSSTESAQDNYLDQQDRRSEVNSQSSHAHSNSSDSLDSTRANSLARGIPRPPHIIHTPIATPREPIIPITINASTETSDSAIQHESLISGLHKGNLVVEELLVAPIPRRKLSSIGIQVGDVTFAL